MTSFLKIKVITPVKIIFEEENIRSVTLPTDSGEITILPNHIPLITKVAAGEMTIKRSNAKDESFVVTEGFLKLNKDGSITLLSDYAVRSDEIEIAKVEEAKKKAEAAMKEKLSDRDFAIAESELRRTLLELKVSRRRQKR